MPTQTTKLIMQLTVSLNTNRGLAFDQNLQITELEHNISEREALLIPVDGWPGTNETSRKAARDRCYTHDEQLVTWHQALDDQHRERLRTVLNIQSIESELHAVELSLQSEQLALAASRRLFSEPIDLGMAEALDNAIYAQSIADAGLEDDPDRDPEPADAEDEEAEVDPDDIPF